MRLRRNKRNKKKNKVDMDDIDSELIDNGIGVYFYDEDGNTYMYDDTGNIVGVDGTDIDTDMSTGIRIDVIDRVDKIQKGNSKGIPTGGIQGWDLSKESMTIHAHKEGNSIAMEYRDTTMRRYKECPLDAHKFTIELPYEIYKKLAYLTDKMQPHEWSGILEGILVNDHTIRVVDFGIPKQRVGHTHTTFEGIPSSDDDEIILGHFHSHPFSNGIPSWSGIDENGPLANMPYAILMSGSHDMVGRVNLLAPCGIVRTYTAEVKVIYELSPEDRDRLDKMIEDNIEREEPRVIRYTYPGRRTYPNPDTYPDYPWNRPIGSIRDSMIEGGIWDE